MRRDTFEIFIGTIVIVISVFFAYYVYNNQRIDGDPSGYYILHAEFNKVDGVVVGTDIKISGIKVGKVIDQSLNKDDYQAILKLKIANDIQLSDDTSAQIVSDGLLGGKYVVLQPGSGDEVLADGGMIMHTQSSISMEGLIMKFMTGKDA